MPLRNKKKVVLIRATLKNADIFFNTNKWNELKYWIYVGKNITLFSEIEKIIGDRINRINTSDSLQNAARGLRRPYIDFVGGIAQNENKIAWNLSAISEKNLFESNLYLTLCYLEILDHEITECQGSICILCEDPALIRTIYKNFIKRTDLTVVVQDFDPISTTVLQRFLKKTRLLNNKVSFIRDYGKRILYAKLLQIRKNTGVKIPTNEPVIAIHSWTDQRSFLIDGSFSEPYYGNLGHLLEKNGNQSFYVIDILSSYPEALKKLSEIKNHWKLFEDFLGFLDIFRACHLARGRKRKFTTDIFFLKHEISELLNEEFARDKFSNRAEKCALHYFAARRMARQFSINTFIYTFENHIWERMAIIGLRESSPNTMIIGYAHSAVNKMNLVYSLSEHEKNMISIPDIILVNGPQAQEILRESGFGGTNIQIIGSLRYGNLQFSKRENSARRFEILVVLSGDFDRSLEMIFKCVDAFRGAGDFSITFKPHPTIMAESLMKYTERMPKNFSLSSKPLHTLFETANLVIYNDSAASVEAASLGIPLLHIKSDFTIDMNIFEDAEIIPSVSSPEQIRIQSQKILDGNYPSYDEIQTYVKQIFSPVDEKKIIEIIS